jgi:hypothetical protein
MISSTNHAKSLDLPPEAIKGGMRAMDPFVSLELAPLKNATPPLRTRGECPNE